MSLEGEKLATLYVIGCPSRGDDRVLVDFLENNKRRSEALKILKALDPPKWFKLIARENGIDDIWDERIVRALWTGNDLTKEMEYKGRIVLPFHNFDILEPSPIDYSLIDSHKVSGAKVLKIIKETEEFLVEYRALVWQHDKFILNKQLKRRKVKIGGRAKKARPEDFISFHFGSAREILEEKDLNFLIKKTEEAISLFNRSSDKSPVKL